MTDFTLGQNVQFRPDFSTTGLCDLVFQIHELPRADAAADLFTLTIKPQNGRRAYRLAWGKDLIPA